MKRVVLPTMVLEDVGEGDGATPARLGLSVASARTGKILKQIDQRVHERLAGRLSAEQLNDTGTGGQNCRRRSNR